MISTPKDRLGQYLKAKRLSISKFADLCGIDKSVVSRFSQTTAQSTLNKIDSNCDVNIDWLLNGEGKMYKEKSGVDKDSVAPRNTEQNRMIPFYDAETTGGYNGLVSASSEGTLVGYIQPGGWFDGRETAAIRHVGDSMTEYPNGCVLAVKEVKDRHLLVPGRNYVIETSEYRVTKRVQPGSSPSSIKLYSTNTEKYEDGTLIHAPFEIEFEDIRRIFSVLGYIVNQTGEFRLIKQ